MAADGLATAAFVLGLHDGKRLPSQSGVAGVLITPSGAIHRT
jgi:thiamine biosynthesis lipoprotein ApbE